MICPSCNGTGFITAFHVRYADGTSRFGVDLGCGRCGGTKEVPDEMAQWIAEGKAMREERIARGFTLRKEAARRNMNPSELSAMEQGKVKPIPSGSNDHTR